MPSGTPSCSGRATAEQPFWGNSQGGAGACGEKLHHQREPKAAVVCSSSLKWGSAPGQVSRSRVAEGFVITDTNLHKFPLEKSTPEA